MEKWKKIPFAPSYEVSSYGRVRHLHKTTPANYIKPKTIKTGYLEVSISIRPNVRKTVLLHRLVLSTFAPIDGWESLEVNHIDEDKSNCRLSNLQWMTPKENCNYGTRNQKVSINKRRKIQCIETGMIYSSIHEASLMLNINVSSLCMACKRTARNASRSNRGTGLHFRYID